MRVAPVAFLHLRSVLGSEGFWGWAGPLLCALLAGAVRLWDLDSPSSLVFDEVYYVEDARALLEYGVEYDPGAGPSFVVHPPVGKWVIAAGIHVAGASPLGWRLGVCLVGALTVFVLARAARRLFASTLLGCAAGLLLAFDGLHFVLSRVALLDGVLTFFVVAAFAALLVDRERERARLGTASFSFRPWRLAAGVLLGLACATKWSGLYYLAAFALLSLYWDLSLRWRLRSGLSRLRLLLSRGSATLLSLVGTASGVYVLSWVGWFSAPPERAWGRTGDPAPSWLPEPLWDLGRYHREILSFHTGLSSEHPYEASPWEWLLLLRPTAMFYETPSGCAASECAAAVHALGNPLLWWPGLVALLVVALSALRRSASAPVILVGFAAGIVPWLFFPDRTMFYFYAVALSPWLALLLVEAFRLFLASSRPASRWWAWAAGFFFLVSYVALFGYFHPVLSGELVPYEVWRDRMWLSSWI